ncbi:MAG: WYL domain-containing protein [Chloroflexi bacterium]|nr:WYL domain-containing protein [Chloroflexota bacterium]
MKMSESKRQDRIDRVQRTLQMHPNGLREVEVAEIVNIHQRTVNNYLRELETQGLAYRDAQLWFPIARRPMVLRPIVLKPEEAMSLYLAVRLFVKHADQRNEAAESVLLKLADILSSDMNLGDDIRKAAYALARRPQSPGYEDIFRTVMQAYIYRRQIELVYHPYRGRPFKTTFATYLLEPSAIGFATYAIGHSSVANALRTYKLERIEQARLLPSSEYEIPANFPGLELLRNAWSIYHGEETTQVTLRFHPLVVRRVQETHWHPSQQVTQDGDYLLVSFEVADTTDLKPWIRTWGANCEVLGPSDLRDEMMGEARKLAQIYGWDTHRSSADDEEDPLGLNETFGDYFG